MLTGALVTLLWWMPFTFATVTGRRAWPVTLVAGSVVLPAFTALLFVIAAMAR